MSDGPCYYGEPMNPPKPTQDLWTKLQQEVSEFKFHHPKHRILAQKLLEGTLSSHQDSAPKPLQKPLLPLSWLKIPTHNLRIWNSTLPAEYFLSSGTTSSSPQPSVYSYPAINRGRSLSLFSHDGLFLYKISALKGFFHCLEKTPHPLENFQGVSFIPPLSKWPHSSLAQMIMWFAEYFPLHYIQNTSSLPKELSTHPHTPTWLFATGAHLLDLLKASLPLSLADQRSPLFIFETGGLKNLTSDHKSPKELRKSLYQELAKVLKLPLSHIGGEYSSCELSCQAWSFNPSSPGPSYEAPYHFLEHIELGIDPHSTDSKSGALTLYDPLRVDLPYTLLTEDLAHLGTQNQVDFLGRAPLAPLRGCSLRVTPQNSLPWVGDSAPNFTLKPSTSYTKSIPQILCALKNLMKSPTWYRALLKEFHDPLITKQACDDLLFSLPEDPQKALKQSKLPTLSSSLPPSSAVAILAPNNHSLACLYPIFFLLIAGYTVKVRVPRSFRHAHSPLMIYLKTLSDLFNCDIEILSWKWRITQTSDLKEIGCDSVFFFGTQNTLQNLSSLGPKTSLRGFGHSYSLSLILPTDPQNPDLMALALKDAFSLAGRGCLSSQMLCLPQAFYPLWRKTLPKIPGPQLSTEDRGALSARLSELRSAPVPYIRGASPLIFPFFLDPPNSLGFSLTHLFQPFTHGLPTVFYQDLDTFIPTLKSCADLKHISTPTPSKVEKLFADHKKAPQIRALGSIGRVPWDGLWEGMPLFALRSTTGP